MAIVKSKQLENVVTTDVSGALFISASAAAYGFGSSNGPWIVSGNRLYTQNIYNTEVTGSLNVLGNVDDVFIIKSINKTQNLLSVSSSGIVKFFVQPTNPTGSAEYGAVYFTSSSLFLGLD